MAAAGVRVLFVTIEMQPQAIGARILAGTCGLNLSTVLRGLRIAPDGQAEPLTRYAREVGDVAEAARRLGQLPIAWMYHGSPTTAQIRGHARGLARRSGLDVIVIDYLGLCRPAAPLREGNRVQEVGAITRECKAMAVDLGVPVVLLSQLSRAVESREDQRPRMSDLRDSGEIEQHSDVIGLLYREHYYLVRNKPARKPREKLEDFEARVFEWMERVRRAEGRAELDIAKNRQGPAGPVRLLFRDASSWFADESEDAAGEGFDA
jgi:replicative DNA helicase